MFSGTFFLKFIMGFRVPFFHKYGGYFILLGSYITVNLGLFKVTTVHDHTNWGSLSPDGI